MTWEDEHNDLDDFPLEECMGGGCVGGRECPCWVDGAEEGSFNTTDEAVTEALSTAHAEIERILNEVLRPLEDRLFLGGDKSVQAEVNHLSDLKRRVLEAVS